MIFSGVRLTPQLVCGTSPTWECLSHAPIVTHVPVMDDIGIQTGTLLAPTEGFVIVGAAFVLSRILTELAKARIRRSRDGDA